MRITLGSRLPLVVTLAVAALTSLGCGSQVSGVGSPIATPASPSGATLVSPAPPSSGDSSVAPELSSAGSHRCHTPDIGVELLPAQGATGHSFRSVALHNTAGGTCTVYGYVGMLMLDAAGHALPTAVQRGGGMLGTPPPTTVSLPPMAIAYFELEYSDIQNGPSPCPTSSQLEVTPPDETTHVIVSAELTPCAGGRLIITALHSGAPRA